jgi:hypothetical protein
MIDASFDAPKRLIQFAIFFRPCFTKRAFASFLFYLCGMLLDHRRLSIQSIAAKAPLAVYGRLQYFVSESKWSTDDVNERRLAYLQSKRALAATADGDLIVDDSACPKPYALHTEGAVHQYAGIAKACADPSTYYQVRWGLLRVLCNGQVGAVFSIEASRLARNGRDWHTLLDFCSVVGALLIDAETIYDPRLTNDRLLLGMKGTISEMEVASFRERAQPDAADHRGRCLWRKPDGPRSRQVHLHRPRRSKRGVREGHQRRSGPRRLGARGHPELV